MNDHASEYDDTLGVEFARSVRALMRELPGEDRLAALLRGLAVESPDFARPRKTSPAPALRLLAYDGLITDLLGEELAAGLLDRSALERLGRCVAEEGPC